MKLQYITDGQVGQTTRVVPRGLCDEGCPFYDDSSGFCWCNWYKTRLEEKKNPECGVRQIVIEEV